jgi:hypothetical protein
MRIRGHQYNTHGKKLRGVTMDVSNNGDHVIVSVKGDGSGAAVPMFSFPKSEWDKLSARPGPPPGIVNIPLACGHVAQIKRQYIDVIKGHDLTHCNTCNTPQKILP